MTVSLIVAVSTNGFIGKDGSLPWQISEDLKRFRKITSNSVVIMGKNTFLSIGKPLPNRENIVVSTTLKSADGCEIVRSLDEAINSSKENFPNKDIKDLFDFSYEDFKIKEYDPHPAISAPIAV